MSGILPNKLLTERFRVIVHGLVVEGDGQGRVVVTDGHSRTYSDSHYDNIDQVERTVNNIITVKWGR